MSHWAKTKKKHCQYKNRSAPQPIIYGKTKTKHLLLSDDGDTVSIVLLRTLTANNFASWIKNTNKNDSTRSIRSLKKLQQTTPLSKIKLPTINLGSFYPFSILLSIDLYFFWMENVYTYTFFQEKSIALSFFRMKSE